MNPTATNRKRGNNEDARISWAMLLLICVLTGLPFGIGLTVMKLTAAPAVSKRIEPAGTLNYPRAFHTAVPIGDGKVVIFGGKDAENNDVTVAEMYDPDQQTWLVYSGDTAELAGSPGASTADYATSVDLANLYTLVVDAFGGGLISPDAETTGLNVDELRRVGASATRLVNETRDTDGLVTGVADYNQKVLVAGGYRDGSDPRDMVADAVLFNPAHVETDKDDYMPGERIYLSGSGWKAGEMVDIYVVDNAVTEEEWVYDQSVRADEHGAFVVEPYLFEVLLQHLGVTFDLSAVGQTSGENAKVQFTDATALDFVADPSGVTVGVAFSVTIQHKQGANLVNVAGDKLVTLSVSTGTGTLSGTTSGTILNGTSSVTINGIIYSKAENSVKLTASTSDPDIKSDTTGFFNVTRASTTTTVTSSKSPSCVGEAVSFTASVAPPGSGIPTGTVQFKIDGSNFGAPVTLAGGSAASGSTSSLTSGNHTITAVYSGDINFDTSTSADFTQSVQTTSEAPVVNSGLCAGATSVSGTSAGGNTTLIVVYVNGNSSGVTSVTSGAWTATVSSLSAGDVVTAKATVAGECQSPASAAVTVDPTSAGGAAGTNPAVVCSGSTSEITLTGNTGAIQKWQKKGVSDLDWVDIVSTANPLTTAALSETTQFRAVVKSGVCPEASSTAATVTVVQTVVSVTPDTQQYSDLVTFTASLSPSDLLPDGSEISFYVGTQLVGTAQLSGGSAILSDVALLEPTPFGTAPNGQMAPGVHTVTASFGSDDVCDPTTELTIKKEDATAQIVSDCFAVTSPSTGKATITLIAVVEDISATDQSDEDPGDIRNAKVCFVNRDNNTVITEVAVGLIDPADSTRGTAVYNWNVDIGAADYVQYTIGIVVKNYYSRNSSDDNTVVTVAKPVLGMISGGGYLLIDSSSKGLYPGNLGSKNNFGFNVKYNKSGKNLQGNINTIIRSGDQVYQIKGNAMTSLKTSSTSVGGTATFNGKANIQNVTDPDNPVSVEGNATLQVKMTDNGEPGRNDKLTITVWDKNNNVWYSNSWIGTQSVEQTIAGGNLMVR